MKDATGNQCSRSVQQYRIDTGGNTWFIPCKCIFRIRCSLTQVREDGEPALPVLSSADIAQNVRLASNTFNCCSAAQWTNLRAHIRANTTNWCLEDWYVKYRKLVGPTGQLGHFWDVDFGKRREQFAVYRDKGLT